MSKTIKVNDGRDSYPAHWNRDRHIKAGTAFTFVSCLFAGAAGLARRRKVEGISHADVRNIERGNGPDPEAIHEMLDEAVSSFNLNAT